MLGGVSVSVSLEITDIIHICYCTMVIDVYHNCNQKEKNSITTQKSTYYQVFEIV